jgi:hypothetical protein
MTTATRTEDDVKRDILLAMADGDDARVRMLQEEFRTGFAVTRLSAEPPQLVWPTTRSTATTGSRLSTWSPLDDILRAPALGVVPGPLTVVVTLAAQEGIRSTMFDDGLELAGGLYGRLVDGELRLENVSVMRDVCRTSSSTYISRQQIEQMGDHFAAAGWRPVGDWHTHPSFRDEVITTPSVPDRTAWKLMAERYGVAWVGLILTPWRCTEKDGDVWGSLPRITGWITEHGSICSPARLVIETDETL